jgi:hypothetical protein
MSAKPKLSCTRRSLRKQNTDDTGIGPPVVRVEWEAGCMSSLEGGKKGRFTTKPETQSSVADQMWYEIQAHSAATLL